MGHTMDRSVASQALPYVLTRHAGDVALVGFDNDIIFYGQCLEGVHARVESAQGREDGGGVMKRVGFVLMLLAGSAVTVQAQDPQNGAQWASNVCAECHATRAGQAPSPNGRAPTFAELANAPGMTSAALTVALTTPHAGMPMFVLTSEQRQDIIAYILSLKTSR